MQYLLLEFSLFLLLGGCFLWSERGDIDAFIEQEMYKMLLIGNNNIVG